MTNKTLMLCAAALLAVGSGAGCSADPETTVAPPPPATGESRGPTVLAAAGESAPDFTLSPVEGGAGVSLAGSLKAAEGKPTVLVLGSASCSFSREEIEHLAEAKPAYRVLAVIQGTPDEVKGSLPGAVPFPVLVDADGGVLAKYKVNSTPSVVVLDGTGKIAYIGAGGYLPPAMIGEMTGSVAKGVPIDVTTIKPQGG
jgi:hypothetical protein